MFRCDILLVNTEAADGILSNDIGCTKRLLAEVEEEEKEQSKGEEGGKQQHIRTQARPSLQKIPPFPFL